MFTVGTCGSGKSYFSKIMHSQYKKSVILDRDDIRRDLTGDVNNHSQEDKVLDIYYKNLKHALDNYPLIILSDPHLSEELINSSLEFITKDHDPVIQFLLFEDSRMWDIVIKRLDKDATEGIDRSGIPDWGIIHQQEKYDNISKCFDTTFHKYSHTKLWGQNVRLDSAKFLNKWIFHDKILDNYRRPNGQL